MVAIAAARAPPSVPCKSGWIKREDVRQIGLGSIAGIADDIMGEQQMAAPSAPVATPPPRQGKASPPVSIERLSQLSLGEMATIRMPAAKAWGKTGIPGLIPPNEDLEFEVELMAVQ